MPDYCRQCSIEIFGDDYGDLKNLCKSGQTAIALCEGCGGILVDSFGNCLTEKCLGEHRKDQVNGS